MNESLIFFSNLGLICIIYDGMVVLLSAESNLMSCMSDSLSLAIIATIIFNQYKPHFIRFIKAVFIFEISTWNSSPISCWKWFTFLSDKIPHQLLTYFGKSSWNSFSVLFVFCCRSRREEGWWRKSTWSKIPSLPFRTCWMRSPVLGRELKSEN